MEADVVRLKYVGCRDAADRSCDIDETERMAGGEEVIGIGRLLDGARSGEQYVCDARLSCCCNSETLKPLLIVVGIDQFRKVNGVAIRVGKRHDCLWKPTTSKLDGEKS